MTSHGFTPFRAKATRTKGKRPPAYTSVLQSRWSDAGVATQCRALR
jgi:hypothetical protein